MEKTSGRESQKFHTKFHTKSLPTEISLLIALLNEYFVYSHNFKQKVFFPLRLLMCLSALRVVLRCCASKVNGEINYFLNTLLWVELQPPEDRMLQSWLSVPQNVTLLQSELSQKLTTEDTLILAWAEPLTQYYWCPVKREDLGTDIRTRRTSNGRESRHGGMRASQAKPKIVNQPPEARKEAQNTTFRRGLGRKQPRWHLHLRRPEL